MNKNKTTSFGAHVSKLRKPGKTRAAKKTKGNAVARTSRTGNGKRID